MKSIVSKGLVTKKRSKIFKTSLALVLIVFAFTMSTPSSFFQIVKPAEAAGTLTSISILPTTNIVNTRTTYDIFFKTATTGTIKTIQLEFETRFDVSAANKLVERSGIGSGSLSAPSKTTLIYTVSSPVTVGAGTTIRLEIARIVNSNFAGSFKVTITTKNTSGGTIDGPTLSPSFPIKDITGDDVSPNFMLRKTLGDDAVGNAKGWNPNGVAKDFIVLDSDVGTSRDSTLISAVIQLTGATSPVCTGFIFTSDINFGVSCDRAVPNGAELQYIITKLPEHIVTSSLSVSPLSTSSEPSSPSSSSLSSQDLESARSHDQTASEFP